MKNLKTLLSLILTFSMALALCAVPAHAAGTQKPVVGPSAITIKEGEAPEGGLVVTLSVAQTIPDALAAGCTITLPEGCTFAHEPDVAGVLDSRGRYKALGSVLEWPESETNVADLNWIDMNGVEIDPSKLVNQDKEPAAWFTFTINGADALDVGNYEITFTNIDVASMDSDVITNATASIPLRVTSGSAPSSSAPSSSAPSSSVPSGASQIKLGVSELTSGSNGSVNAKITFNVKQPIEKLTGLGFTVTLPEGCTFSQEPDEAYYKNSRGKLQSIGSLNWQETANNQGDVMWYDLNGIDFDPSKLFDYDGNRTDGWITFYINVPSTLDTACIDFTDICVSTIKEDIILHINSELSLNADRFKDDGTVSFRVCNEDGSTTVTERYDMKETVTEKDAEGKVTKETATEKNAEGNVIRTTEIVYHEDGTTVTVIECSADGTVIETVTEMDADGKVTKETVTEKDVDGNVIKTTEALNHDDGTMTVIETMCNAEGTVKETVTEKDAEGKVTKETATEKDADGNTTKTTEIVYHEDGWQTVTETERNEDGTTTETVTEMDADGNVAKMTETVYHEDGWQTVTEAEYDLETGNVTKKTVTEKDADGNVAKETVTEKDADGNVTKETCTVLNEDGTTTVCEAEYDHATGNTTKETVTEKDAEGNVTAQTITEMAYDSYGKLVSTTTTDALTGESTTTYEEPTVRYGAAQSDDAGADDISIAFSEDYTTVTATAAAPHVLFAKKADGSYQRLIPQKNADGSYSFDLTVIDGGFSLVTALAGDVDGDGFVNVTDVARLIREKYNPGYSGALSSAMCDINADGRIDILDISQLIRCRSASAENPVHW